MGLLLLAEAAFVFFQRSGTILADPGSVSENFAAPDKIGVALFSAYLLPFEITSVILLAALVGVVVLHQRDTRLGRAADRDVLQEMSTIAPEPTQAKTR
jgi:NADH-quinone oxidoreductase subunit J